MIGWKTSTWAGAVRSIQILIAPPTRCPATGAARTDALVPQREHHQTQQRAGLVGAARRGAPAPAARPPPARTGPGGARPPAESRSITSSRASWRSQRAAGIEKPRLRPSTTSRRQQRAHGPAQQPLLLQPAHLQRRRGCVAGELEHAVVDERHAGLERVGHRGAVGLGQQVVGQVGHRVDVLQPRQRPGVRPPRRSGGAGRPAGRPPPAPTGSSSSRLTSSAEDRP